MFELIMKHIVKKGPPKFHVIEATILQKGKTGSFHYQVCPKYAQDEHSHDASIRCRQAMKTRTLRSDHMSVCVRFDSLLWPLFGRAWEEWGSTSEGKSGEQYGRILVEYKEEVRVCVL